MSIYCIEQPIGPFGEMLIEQNICLDSSQRKQGFDLHLIRRLRQYIKTKNIHILHCHQYTPWVYGTLASIGTKTKIVFTEHGRFYPDSSSWKRKIINPILCYFTSKITAISKATKQALTHFEFIPNSKIDVIYNGIKPLSNNQQATHLIRNELKISASTTILGTIARLDPIKNHSMMFKAFKQVLVTHPNTVLILVGDGEERKNLEQLVKQLNIVEKVIFTGYISKPQHYLNCFDIFLLPSFSEGTSMTLLEAMSLSKPCVVTDAGGNPEIIIHKKNGFVTENDHEQQYTQALQELLNNPQQHKKMEQEALLRFQNLFNVKHMCLHYKNLYKAIFN